LKSKKYRLHEGKLNDDLINSKSNVYLTQEEAVIVVRNDMMSLNAIIMSELMKLGIKCKSFPPHQHFSETGPDFLGELNEIDLIPEGEVAITFGDVVNCDNELKFGILSGDDIVKRLAIDLSNISRVVFAVGGVDGLLQLPPDKATKNDLIDIWSVDMPFEGKHYSDIDVTGGIFLKADRGAMIADYGIDVRLVNGEYSDRVFSASIGDDFYGTSIISKFKNKQK
jgi:isopentenyl phosphate kinase